MKKLTKITSFTLCLVSALALASCKSKTTTAKATTQAKVTTTAKATTQAKATTKAKATTTAKATTKANNTTAHVHNFDKEVLDSSYLTGKTSCLEYHEYYKSCSCGEVGTTTFIGKTILDHNIVDNECKNGCGLQVLDYDDTYDNDIKVATIKNNKIYLLFETKSSASYFSVDAETLQKKYNAANSLENNAENRIDFIKSVTLYDQDDLTIDVNTKINVRKNSEDFYAYYISETELDKDTVYYLVIELDAAYSDYYNDLEIYFNANYIRDDGDDGR